MIKKAEKEQMGKFITEQLEESCQYNILESDKSHILIAQKPDLVQLPKTTNLLLHNYSRTINEAKNALKQNRLKKQYTGHVFYKNDADFMVRLGSSGKVRDDKSLKKYTSAQINAMILLRGLEKEVMEEGFTRLTYYQPHTQMLPESIRIYAMNDVNLDYSHIDQAHRSYGFVTNRKSIDYKLPIEEKVSSPLQIRFDDSKYIARFNSEK